MAKPRSGKKNPLKVNLSSSSPRPPVRHGPATGIRPEKDSVHELLVEVRELKHLVQSELTLVEMQLTASRQQLDTVLTLLEQYTTMDKPVKDVLAPSNHVEHEDDVERDEPIVPIEENMRAPHERAGVETATRDEEQEGLEDEQEVLEEMELDEDDEEEYLSVEWFEDNTHPGD